eukprot:163662-Prymnesium_polylepis.1
MHGMSRPSLKIHRYPPYQCPCHSGRRRDATQSRSPLTRLSRSYSSALLSTMGLVAWERRVGVCSVGVSA